jgi:hypothetical protein
VRRTLRIRVCVAAVVVILGGVFAGCATTTGTPRQQMSEWANDASYDADNSQILTDITQIHLAMHIRNLLDLRTDCDGFGADVQTLYGELPTPDQTATNELNTSLENDLENFSLSCYELSSMSGPKYTKVVAELNRGVAAYATARKRIASFGVH